MRLSDDLQDVWDALVALDGVVPEEYELVDEGKHVFYLWRPSSSPTLIDAVVDLRHDWLEDHPGQELWFDSRWG